MRFVLYCKRVGWKRFWMMLIGNIFVGMGVALFKMSAMGNDPFNGMNMALSSVIGISYPVVQILVNIVLFVIQLLTGRRLIGFGTIVNAFFLGYIVSFLYWAATGAAGLPQSIFMRVVTVVLGVIVSSFGLSLYQRSDAGVAPYDSMAMILDERLPRLPYFWCRMITDGCCALVLFLAGGILGLGTVLTVFCLGPFVHFFDRNFTERFLLKSTKNEK